MWKEERGFPFYKPTNVFYNPHMQLSRDLAEIIVESLSKKYSLHILDGFSATGIRGFRYAKFAKTISFVDINKDAVEAIKKGIIRNNIKDKSKVYNENIVKHLIEHKNYNFIELDPFGSPYYYIPFALFSLKDYKTAFLSITATDTAVSCGKHYKACIRYYGSIPLRNHFCHETGLRILLYYLWKQASFFDFAIKPLLSFYYRHQIKIIIQLQKSKKMAESQENLIKILYYDPKTLASYEYGKCYKDCKLYGPIWVGKIYDKEIVEQSLESAKKYNVDKMLNLIKNELDMPFYYTMPLIAKRLKSSIPKIEKFFNNLLNEGFKVSRVHYEPQGFKTNASIEDIERIFNYSLEK